MSYEKKLATKLHDKLCPKCNGRCNMNNYCSFTHNPTETDWINIYDNSYFLELAQKGIKIMEEAKITEEHLLMCASPDFPFEDIPKEVFSLMEKYNFC